MARKPNSKQLHYESGHVPLGLVNVLPQPRKTFTNIPFLADDIARKGYINPPTVACFTREAAAEFVSEINQLWRAEFYVDELLHTGDHGREIYYVLLAGERRVRAAKHLFEHSCSRCREEHGGKARRGQCFRRHFEGNAIEVRLCRNISPDDALKLQFSENTHMAVPPWEEARAYGQFYRRLKAKGAITSLAGFARDVGRSPETIRRALWYCELPDSIQEAVEQQKIAYGIGVQLARLQLSAEATEEELLRWLLRWMTLAIVRNEKVPEFEERVSKYLADRSSGQLSLENLMTEAAEELERRLAIRKPVEIHSIRALWGFLHYFHRVKWLFDKGLLGKEDSPFSSGSTIRIFRRVLEAIEEILPCLRGLLPKKVYVRAEPLIEEAVELVAAIEAHGAT